MTAAITTPQDLKDQHWLDEKVEQIEMGVEAVLDIARNWTDGRRLARLHPGVSAAEYVTGRVGVLGKSVVPVLLEQSNWSHPQIAAIAGVTRQAVDQHASKLHVGEQRESLGADGKLRTYAPRVVEAVVIDTPTEIDDQPNPASLDAYYVKALRDYIAAIVNVTAPAVGLPPLMRKRRAIERALQAALSEFIGEQ